MSKPMLVVTADADLSDREREYLKRDIETWLASPDGTALVVTNAKVHVAAEQPDGTWVRVCHEHAQPASETLAEVQA